MYGKDRPEPRDPVLKVTIALPRSDLTELDREVFRRQDREGRAAASRDAVIRELIRTGLQALAERRLAG
jgi:hypothetical protein